MVANESSDGGVITSIATTITIGSTPCSSLANSNDPSSVSHSVRQSSAGPVSVGDNNTFRPLVAPHQSPSLTNRQSSIRETIDLSERDLGSHVDRFTSLPRHSGSSHIARPSSRYISDILIDNSF